MSIATMTRAGAVGALAMLCSFAVPASVPALAAPTVGEPAPEFTAIDSQGQSRSLTDFRGKTVVLEWTNHDCPYVRKHYETGNMQALQKDATADGVVWLSVISSPPGEQGHVEAAEADRLTGSRNAAPTAVLLDPDSKVARAYAARVTPHMFVIDGQGTLRFMGGIDDKPTSRHSSVEGARNYVRLALADLAAGRDVQEATTRPYGCAVKYAE
ncbi:MAG: redoxin domain-containing protein [Acetobacterales bacterium]